MDFDTPLSPAILDGEWREPVFRDRAQALNSLLAELEREELKALMKISPALAEQTAQMISSFSRTEGRPALAAYSGTAFRSLEPSSLDAESLRFACEHLRILSGMYGLLGPMDTIAPYRMEMKTPLAVGGSRSLTAYWAPLVSKSLEKEKWILNLASAEYSRTVSFPKDRMVDVLFREERGGTLKTVGMYAKQARGLMLRQLLEGQISEPHAIRALTPGNYRYRDELSGQGKWVFVRTER